MSIRIAGLAAGAVGAALAVRVVRSRHRRSLHPAGRSFAGTLVIHGFGELLGAASLDQPAEHRVTVRLSKGVGTRGGRADVRGLAVRVHLRPVGDLDLLLSTAGDGRLTRHLPVPRRSFDATYGTITPYRTGAGRQVYLSARPDPDSPGLGRDLDAAAGSGRALLLGVRLGDVERVVGRLTFGHPLAPAADEALAFDPVRNSLPDLHPTGLVHGTRAYAYRVSQRWRGARSAAPNPQAVARTEARS